ncbi:hypothetical protein ABIC83_002778 [Roseateles asaccharophilus]|uniref:TfuA-like protein n=1 Tax=Roseateles asaccharophilus TaxID=582607 RepID=UPI00383992E6
MSDLASSRPVVIFAGPSLYGAGIDRSATPDIDWQPPARRGDFDRLLEASPPGVIGLADGTFHAFPSVGHAEILRALKGGWTVYGLCSMGAIRACEMKHLGMKPWGRVAEMFVADPDLADDEVALVHGADEPYLPISEPMLHIREFLAQADARGLLTSAQVEVITTRMHRRWYGERTLGQLRSEITAACGGRLSEQLLQAIKKFSEFRLKQKDLEAFIESRPWLCQESTGNSTYTSNFQRDPSLPWRPSTFHPNWQSSLRASVG